MVSAGIVEYKLWFSSVATDTYNSLFILKLHYGYWTLNILPFVYIIPFKCYSYHWDKILQNLSRSVVLHSLRVMENLGYTGINFHAKTVTEIKGPSKTGTDLVTLV